MTYALFVTTVNKNLFSCSCIPNLHRLIITTRSNTRTIRRPGYTKDSAGMTMIGEKLMSIGCILYLNSRVSAAG
jgi:hypothetical protein